jgi:hypothetical protein
MFVAKAVIGKLFAACKQVLRELFSPHELSADFEERA